MVGDMAITKILSEYADTILILIAMGIILLFPFVIPANDGELIGIVSATSSIILAIAALLSYRTSKRVILESQRNRRAEHIRNQLDEFYGRLLTKEHKELLKKGYPLDFKVLKELWKKRYLAENGTRTNLSKYKQIFDEWLEGKEYFDIIQTYDEEREEKIMRALRRDFSTKDQNEEEFKRLKECGNALVNSAEMDRSDLVDELEELVSGDS